MLVEGTSASVPYRFYLALTYTATSYTQSIYAKANGRNYIVLWNNSGASVGQCTFDLSAGTVVTPSNCTAAISSVGNGWYRCSITFTALAGAANTMFQVQNNSTNGYNSYYTGNGYSGIYVWGAQLEATAFPTSYIPTVASQVTRSADSAINSGTNFSQWFDSQQGTVYCSFDTPSIASTAPNMAIWGIDNGTTAQYYANKSTATLTAYQGTANASMGTITANTTQQSTYTFNNSTIAASGLINGGSVGTITATSQSNIPTQLTFGRYITSSNLFTGHIRKLAFYPISTTTAQMQALTGS
jgi:hypothetical protein